MTRTRISQALLVLAITADMFAIWWGEYRWQFVATGVLLFIAAAVVPGTTDEKENDQ